MVVCLRSGVVFFSSKRCYHCVFCVLHVDGKFNG